MTEINVNKNDIQIIFSDDEEEMLLNYISLLTTLKPSIITGWFIEFYDIPYLIQRMKIYDLHEQISILNVINQDLYDTDEWKYFKSELEFDNLILEED